MADSAGEIEVSVPRIIAAFQSGEWSQHNRSVAKRFRLGNAKVVLFRVGAPKNRQPDETLWNAVIAARSSYRTYYGDEAPVHDEYDAKSWIYLVVASFTHRGERFTEATTLRLVPAKGTPPLNQDLMWYCSKTRPGLSVGQLLSQSGVVTSVAEAVQDTYSQSRLAVVRPTGTSGRQLGANRYVAHSWGLVLRQFLNDLTLAGQRCALLTTQNTDSIAAVGKYTPLERADTVLGLPSGDLVLNQKLPAVRSLRHRFPAYFLEARSLVTLFGELMDAGRLSSQCLLRFLPPGTDIERFMRRPTLKALRPLGKLLTFAGPLPEAAISGEELRSLVDDRVLDAPVLRLTKIQALKAQLRNLDLELERDAP